MCAGMAANYIYIQYIRTMSSLFFFLLYDLNATPHWTNQNGVLGLRTSWVVRSAVFFLPVFCISNALLFFVFEGEKKIILDYVLYFLSTLSLSIYLVLLLSD